MNIMTHISDKKVARVIHIALAMLGVLFIIQEWLIHLLVDQHQGCIIEGLVKSLSRLLLI